MIYKSSAYYPFFQKICQEFGCAVSDLESSRRGRPYVQAKSVAIRFLRLAGLSYPQVGAILDRDHSTVMHADRKCQSIPELNEMALQFYLQFRQIESRADDDLIKKEIFRNELDREKIIELYNKGLPVDKIAAELEATVVYVENHLKFIRSVYQVKKVPDYKTHTTREIFFQKNQKKVLTISKSVI